MLAEASQAFGTDFEWCSMDCTDWTTLSSRRQKAELQISRELQFDYLTWHTEQNALRASKGNGYGD